MRGVRIVSRDEELIAKIKDALAPLEVNITVSEEFTIEGSDWQPGCLSQIIPFFPKGERPPSESEKQLREMIDFVFLDVVNDLSYQIFKNIRESTLMARGANH